MAPYCYRCPYNRARPERADAREYRKCNWECLGKLEQKFAAQKKKGNPYAAFVVEPLMQGAAGMIPQPAGWLSRAAEIARGYGALLITDEVMTGFGRTGLRGREGERPREPKLRLKSGLARTLALPLFACQQEGVQPDFMALAKGADWGLPADGCDPDNAGRVRRFPWRIPRIQDLLPRVTALPGTSLARRLGWPAWSCCRATPQSAPASGLSNVCATNLLCFWRCPNIGDIRQVGLVAGSSWFGIGGRANRSTCASARAFGCAR